MLKFLNKIQDGQRVPAVPKAAPLSPPPDEAKTPEGQDIIASVNKHVHKELSVAKRGNAGKYNKLDDETRMKIAKKCLEIGATKTARYFSEKGMAINESTVCSNTMLLYDVILLYLYLLHHVEILIFYLSQTEN